MKQVSTLFLRGVIVLIGMVVLSVCIFVLPIGIRDEDAVGYRPVLAGLYVAAIPFFVALYKAMKLLQYIDANKAFSVLSMSALRHIKYCAVTIAGLFVIGMPYIYRAADQDDAPGVLAIGLIIVFASIVIAVFAAVLERLLESAMAIKSENDLTV